MRCIALIGIAAIASLPVLATTERAGSEYLWCAQYGGGEMGGGRNCGFSTVEQCLATVSSIGGFCAPSRCSNLYPAGSKNPSGHSHAEIQRRV